MTTSPRNFRSWLGGVMAKCKGKDHPWFKVITWQEAKELLGHKVNRRKKFYTQSDQGKENADNPYAFPCHKVFTYSEWSYPCSGCDCDCGNVYGCNHGAGGCDECGYTGKRREGMHLPYVIEHEIEFNGLKLERRTTAPKG